MRSSLARCVSFVFWVALYSRTVISYSYEDCEKQPDSNFRIKAVNLGGWLVTEGWIKPSLFDGITNKNFLDGTGLQLKSKIFGKYLCSEGGGGNRLVVNRTSASDWETFRLWRINETSFNFRVSNKQFVGLLPVARNSTDAVVVATANMPGILEIFEIMINPRNQSLVRIKASNGFLLQAKSEILVTADYSVSGSKEAWGAKDPSIFEVNIASTLQGEYQLTNGYGSMKASKVLRDHWSTFIVEDDFQFIAKYGINCVRIPVGWWIAFDSHPPPPFVAGSLETLDKAFSWAIKHNLKVIVDLHAVQKSQNGFEHSASRDGFIEWGQTDDNINQTVEIIGFLSNRYVKYKSFLGVELMNEPLSPGVSLSSLIKYYRAAYAVVRMLSPTLYVILANRLGDMASPTELISFASTRCRTVLDVHYYNLYSTKFKNMSIKQNLEFVRSNRSVELHDISSASSTSWPLSFVGEWVGEWAVKGATREDYRRFTKAQMGVYRQATFGWAYWTLKNVNEHWSLEWMINKNYKPCLNEP